MSIYRHNLTVPENSLSKIGSSIDKANKNISALKTAKLKQQKMENELAKEDAGVKLRENALNKETNALAMSDVDESLQGGMEGGFNEIAPKEVMGDEELNQLRAINPEASEDIIKKERRKKTVSGRIDFYKTNYGMTQEVAEVMANKSVSDMEEEIKQINQLEAGELKYSAEINNDIAVAVMDIMSMQDVDKDGKPIVVNGVPVSKEAKYQELKDDLQNNIDEQRDKGNLRQVEILEEYKKRLPVKFGDGKQSLEIIKSSTQRQKAFQKKIDYEMKRKDTKEDATTKHKRSKSSVITHGYKDIKLIPTDDGWKEDKKTSNALLKQDKVNKGKTGAGTVKTSDYSLINKSTWQNFTGYDIDNPDEKKQLDSKFSQSERDIVTKFSSTASELLRTGKAGSPLEAVQMAKDNASKAEKEALQKIENKKKEFAKTNKDSRFR